MKIKAPDRVLQPIFLTKFLFSKSWGKPFWKTATT